MLAVCTACIQPRAPPKFDIELNAGFNHDAVALYSSRPLHMSGEPEGTPGETSLQASGSGALLFGASTELAAQPKPELMPKIPPSDQPAPSHQLQSSKPAPKQEKNESGCNM